MITYQRVPDQRVLDQSVRHKGSRKKGSRSNIGPFSVRPAQFSKRPEGDTLNVHKSRLYTNQDIHMGGMGPYEMYTIRAAQPEIVSPGAYCLPGHIVLRV